MAACLAGRPSLICYDFDGIMTDNRALVFDDGREAVFINRADGLAIAAIRKAGVPQVIVSTEANDVVLRRAEKLGIRAKHNVADKSRVVMQLVDEYGADLASTVYIGNDVNDLDVMHQVGFPIAPSDAHPAVKQVAIHVTGAVGGAGVVREFYDAVLATILVQQEG